MNAPSAATSSPEYGHRPAARYVVPTTAEIMGTASNGYCVVSTFSGAGGSCLGYRMAGFDVKYAVELVPAAADSYEANFEDMSVDRRDIRQVSEDEILKSVKKERGEIDLLDGSPPCDPFSSAGKRQKSWGREKTYVDGLKQRTDDLTLEYARLLRGIRPKTFVMENVPGLVVGKAKGYFLDILSALKNSGYLVSCRLLDAQWLGVPQKRRRAIFVGVREDLGVEPSHPAPVAGRPVSIEEACPWISKVEYRPSGQFSTVVSGRKSPSSTLNAQHHHFAMWLKGVCLDEWNILRRGEASAKRFNLVRCDERLPAPTITPQQGTGLAAPAHPSEPRRFTVLEGKRLCSFPDDYVLTGSLSQQWQRLGQSVPPLMMRTVAIHVKEEILDRANGVGKWAG